MKKITAVLTFCLIATKLFSQFPDAQTLKAHQVKVITQESNMATLYFLYDENGREIKYSIEDPQFKTPNRSTRIFYNKNAEPDSVTVSGKFSNYKEYYFYNADGSYKLITREKNQADTSFYGKDKKILRQNSSDGSSVKYEYNAGRQLIKQTRTSKSGSVDVITYSYNPQGKIAKKISKIAGGVSSLQTEIFLYNSKGLLIDQSTDYGTSKFASKFSYTFYSKNDAGSLVSFYDASNKKVGYKDGLSGEVKIAAIYDKADSKFLGSLSRVIVNNKWGMIDVNGKYILQPLYQEIDTFKNGMAAVYLNNTCGLIDQTGKIILSPEKSPYIFIQTIPDHLGNQLAVYYDASKKGFVGDYVLLNKKFEEISMLYPLIFKNSGDSTFYLTINNMTDDKSYGLLNKMGKELFAPKYKLITTVPDKKLIITHSKDRTNGLYDYSGKKILDDNSEFYYTELQGKEPKQIIVSNGNKKGVIDSRGNILIPIIYAGINKNLKVENSTNGFESLNKKYDGHFWVKKDGKMGLLNTKLQLLVPLEYDEITNFDYGKVIGTINKVSFLYDLTKKTKTKLNIASDAYAHFYLFNQVIVFKSKEGKSGLMDLNGNVLKPAVFNNEIWFDDEDVLIPAIEDSLFGYINAKGVYVIKPSYQTANGFVKGLACVQQNNKYGFINGTGAFILKPQYDYANYFDGSTAVVNMGGIYNKESYELEGGKWGLIDKTGKEIIPLVYDSFEPGYEDEKTIRVSAGGKFFFIDYKGKKIRDESD